MNDGYILVDLDGTLAEYDGWRGEDFIGLPVIPMINRVLGWMKSGIKVKIFTARVASTSPNSEHARKLIENWCWQYLGVVLEVTAEKDLACIEIWDDRCKQVKKNEGISAEDVIRFYADPNKYKVVKKNFWDQEEVMEDHGKYARYFIGTN